MDFTWVKRKDCKVLLQDSTLVILALLLPIGIDSDDLDPAWLADMNTFGEKRGLVAHTSATSYMTIQTPDPANELNTVTQIKNELLRIDELINNLIE
jgi:hypothetical protein